VKPKSAARVYRGTPRNLEQLARRLQAGELVAVPTETVYGLAANALDPRACRRIYAAKGRPSTDPLIVHINARSQLAQLAETNAAAERLADAFWPGPLTLVLPKKPVVPDVVTSGRPSVAVRMPSHPLLRRLLRKAGLPLAAPSANPFGYVSPTTAEHVRQNMGGRIRYILDGGPARIGLESTIVDLRYPERPRLLRPGAVTLADLRRVLGVAVEAPSHRPGRTRSPQVAPGQLARHYSPRTPVFLHPKIPPRAAARSAPDQAWLFQRRPAGRVSPGMFWLDGRGSLQRAARNLFAVLRRIDDLGFRKIHAELARGGGMAEAINDRLRRSAAKGRGPMRNRS